MSRVVELFGRVPQSTTNWRQVIKAQRCPFTDTRCYKVRKSDPQTSIGTCTVVYGRPPDPVVICPRRMIERGQIFIDCLHLLTTHEPGNELHIVPEVAVPGGNVDYSLVSVQDRRIRDFVGIELQTLDTTGTVWPERQRLLRELGVMRTDKAELSPNSYGMNWKMTAKTILVQMHHKAQTFEHVNKKLVLVIQDRLLAYMRAQFRFDHLRSPAAVGDAVHLHAYRMTGASQTSFRLGLTTRLSTDSAGVGACLGLLAEARVELDQIVSALQTRISASTRFEPV